VKVATRSNAKAAKAPFALGRTFELTYPPKIMNLQWHYPRQDVDYKNDLGNALIDFAQHLSDGPCPCYMLGLQQAHSGRRRIWLCWLYNSFSELEPEDQFWHGAASAEFGRDHGVINRRLSGMYQDGCDLWTVLREDLSHRAEFPARDFARTRFIQIDEITIKPGRSRDFARARATLASAYAKANVEETAWVYELYSGAETEGFQVWRPYPSFTPLDKLSEERARVEAALGEAGAAQIAETAAASIQQSLTSMFAINPGGSYVSSELSQHNPGFWGSLSPPWP
jgi:hypothetical protein